MPQTDTVLIVEDSRADRLRFRSLLEMKGRNFKFAWNAEQIKVPEPKEIIEIIKKLKPSLLLLDIAWKKEDDIRLEKLIFEEKEEIEKIIENESISGFDLLNMLKKEHNSKELFSTIVTTRYIPAVACGLRAYVQKYKYVVDLIHKWRDEKKLLDKL